MKYSVGQFLWEQITATVPPVVEKNLDGKTVIVTGANCGLGFETALHFARMRPGKLILACRDGARGTAAVHKIQHETGCDTVELWLLDLAELDSVKEFANRFDRGGGRLDILIENAAISSTSNTFEPTGDGWEPQFQVNNLSHSLLALRLLPSMLRTAEQYQTTPRLVVVSSEMFYWTTLGKAVTESEHPLRVFGKSKEYISGALRVRYLDTKLLNVFFARALSQKLDGRPLIANCANPGLCVSSIRRNFEGAMGIFNWVVERTLARTAEQGSRTLVWAAIGGEEAPDALRGAYISLSKVVEVSDYVLSEEGQKFQDKLWDDLIAELSDIDPLIADIAKDVALL